MTAPPILPKPGPALSRDLDRKAIAGVASGLSEHLNLPITAIRLGFVVLTVVNGLGVAIYALLWMLLPVSTPAEEAPGLAGGSRAGLRPQRRVNPINSGLLFSVGALLVAMLWTVWLGDGPLGNTNLFWPLLLGGVGVVLAWVQADRAAYRDNTRTRLATIGSIARLVGGLLLVGFGISWILAAQFGLDGFPTVLGAAIALLAGLSVVAAPWLLRAKARLETAEREKLRAEARADMAAHLHDSVLQTLALIQRQASDPATVAQLARRQERELRTWLYGQQPEEQTLKGALEQMRLSVEERFPVAVEVVCVGDLILDEATTALVQAAGEAVTNAAKHSGAPRIDVFAEVDTDLLEVFIRDRGSGFDMAGIGADRRGVKESILARMERHNGSARIRSVPGEGTEVKLEMRR